MKPFDANNVTVENLPEGAPLMACQRPTKRRWAIQINNEEGFQIRNERGIRELGAKGDYLILGPNNSRSICPKDEFTNEYVKVFEQSPEETLKERVVNSSALPVLSDDGSVLFCQALEQIEDGVPEAIHLVRETPEGENLRIRYQYHSQETTDAMILEASEDPTEQLIAEGGGQTHDPES